MKILGLIPARGGSKGVPRKNIKLLGGKPLIQYTIEKALACTSLTDVIVSTEDPEIATISRSLGAQVPFLRPAGLAGDSTPSIDVIIDVLLQLKRSHIHYDAVCLLQPTSPFRAQEEIEECISKFILTEADSLISVKEVPHQYNPHWVFQPHKYDFLKLFADSRKIITRRQDLPKAYIRTGSIYLTKTKVILKSKSLFGDKLAYRVSTSSVEVNIDTLTDWQKAESIIQELEND